MSLTMRCTGITYQENGDISVQFADGSASNFTDLAALQDFAAQAVDPGNTVLLQRLLLLWWLARDANASDSAIIIGKTLTLDMSLALPLDVS